MTKPSNFILHSNYATLKNNANGSLSVTIPNGSSIGANQTRTFSTDIALGKSGGSLRARGRVNSGIWAPGTAIGTQLNMEIPDYGTGIVTQPATAYLIWINASTVRLIVNVQNYAPATMFIRANYTFEFKINTFLAPVQ